MQPAYKHRIQRLMQIIVEVKTEPAQEIGCLLCKLGISKSQFYKDRKVLAGIGFCFDYSRSHRRFIITKDITLPVESLTISEQLSLVMALRHLSAAGDHILTYEGFKAAKKIAAHLPEPLRVHLFDDFVLKEGFKTDSRILDRIQQAITDNYRLTLSYQRPGKSKTSLEIVDPYHIFFKRRALYMEGYSWSENGIRVYRLSRIKEVSFKSRGFSIRSGYDFGRRYRNAFSVFPGETTEHVVVHFGRRIRPYIEESVWHHSQKITPEKDGSIRFEVDVAEPREVLWWGLSWGAEAEILEPDWLRRESREEIERMKHLYGIR